MRDHAVQALVRARGGDDDHLALGLGQAAVLLQQQRIVPGEEGARFVGAVREAEEDVGHEAGLGLHVENARTQVLGQVLQFRHGPTGDGWGGHGCQLLNCIACRRAYRPPRASSSAWLPCSTMRPRSIVTTRSACSIVDRRCAMTSVVRPCISTFKRVLHRALALVVQRRGGLVEDQHRRVLVDRTRDRQALALAARQLAAVVADHAVQALWQRECKVEQVRAVQCRAHARHVGGVAERDVECHRIVEQHHVLADEGELAPQRIDAPIAQRHAVQAQLAARSAPESAAAG